MVSCFAPGKLLLIGEWSVLEDGNLAIVLALSNGITVDVVASPKNGAPSFTFDLLDMKMRFSAIPPLFESIFDASLEQVITFSNVVRTSAKIATLALLSFNKDFSWDENIHVSIRSTISKIQPPLAQSTMNAKPGLGSSAASAVAMIKSLLQFAFVKRQNEGKSFNKFLLNKLTIYKLGVIALALQGSFGSGFDVATAAFGTSLLYKKYNQNEFVKMFSRLKENLNKNLTLSTHVLAEMLMNDWTNLLIKQIIWPSFAKVEFCFCGESALTDDYLCRMKEFRTNEKTRSLWLSFVDKLSSLTKTILMLFEEKETQLVCKTNRKEFVQTVVRVTKTAREVLKAMGMSANVSLETETLTKAIDVLPGSESEKTISIKFSGAGGGDCVLAVGDADDPSWKTLDRLWSQEGFMKLFTSVI